jgi:hypothetical protein
MVFNKAIGRRPNGLVRCKFPPTCKPYPHPSRTVWISRFASIGGASSEARYPSGLWGDSLMPTDPKQLRPSELNTVFRLCAIANRCGPQVLDSAESFDSVVGRGRGQGRFAELNSVVLHVARSIVKS